MYNYNYENIGSSVYTVFFSIVTGDPVEPTISNVLEDSFASVYFFLILCIFYKFVMGPLFCGGFYSEY